MAKRNPTRINPSMVERIVYNAVKSAINPMPRGAVCQTKYGKPKSGPLNLDSKTKTWVRSVVSSERDYESAAKWLAKTANMSIRDARSAVEESLE